MRVTESMGPAWETMKRALFRPFNIGTWFSFGVVFFLQACAEGGGTGGFNLPSGTGNGGSRHPRGGGDSADDLAGLAHGVLSHVGDPLRELFADPGLMVMILVIACVLAIPLILLTMWLGTRGQMMAIRAVAIGQANVSELWGATRSAGTSLFKFQLAMIGLTLLVFLPIAGGGAAVTVPAIRSGASIDTVLPLILGIAFVAILAMLPFAIVGAMARNFVAPIMLKHGLTAREGWKRFWAVGRDHVGSIIVFFLLRLVVGFGAGIVGMIAGLFTCCLGFLPVLHTTLMAPYLVFERAWTLEVLASMSPDFDLRGGGAPPPEAYGGGGPAPFNPYGGSPSGNPYAPPGYGGGYDPSGHGGPPQGGFGAR
jgi:hypothetical protein